MITGFLYSAALSQNMQNVYRIEEVKLNGDNPEYIITVNDPLNDSNIGQIIRIKSELIFLDESFNVIQKRKFDKGPTIVSKRCNYLILLEKKQRLEKDATLINYIGKELWKKTIRYNEEDVITFHPTDYNGNVFMLNHQNMVLTTISTEGNVLNEYHLFDNCKTNPDKRVYIDISETGIYCAVLAEKQFSLESGTFTAKSAVQDKTSQSRSSIAEKQVQWERTDGEPQLFLFDNNGVLLRKMNTEEERPVNLFISEDGNNILYIVEDIDSDEPRYLITLLTNQFEKMFVKETNLYPILSIFMDNQIVIATYDVASNKNLLLSLNINNGSELWMNELENTPLSLKIGLNHNIELITQSIKTINEESKRWVLLYNKSGEIIDRIEVGEVNCISKIKSAKSITPYVNTNYFIKGNKIFRLSNN